ncbi:UNVERIFIED_CONTAM: hypothetical protein GTU68_016563 [Idotea baltica]|nr:hypothetical protein [Idotea baltica]
MNQANKPNTGLKRIVKAAGYSAQGLRAAFTHEAAFRQELLLCIIFIPLALFVANSALERVVLIGLTLLVLVVELLNSALEALVDRVGTEHHELSGRAKDMGSAAVLVCLVIWAYAWIELSFN